jgi:hypothetical protein
MITWILLFVVLAIVGKLIYDRKREPVKPIESGFDVDKLQKLAGIKGEKHTFSNETIKAIKSSIGDMKFPEPDPSIPVNTIKLATIGGDYSDSDPLGDIPLSRVSKEAKQKIAEIAMKDLADRLEETTSKFKPTNPDEVVEKPVKKKRNYNRKPKK